MIAKYIQKFFYLVVYHLIIYDLFIQRGFLFFPRIKVGNLGNLFHDLIIIPFSIANFLQKFVYCKNQKSSLCERKSVVHNFLRTLFWRNIKQ